MELVNFLFKLKSLCIKIRSPIVISAFPSGRATVQFGNHLSDTINIDKIPFLINTYWNVNIVNQISTAISEAGGDISPDKILKMSVGELLEICERNNINYTFQVRKNNE